MKRSLLAVLAVLTLAACSDPKPAPPPNVVLISLDTLRARNLGSYGHPRDTSPFFDSIAARGALFENAVTTSTTTGPAHMSLLTGLYPHGHGLVTGLEAGKVPVSVPRLAKLLKDGGYTTKAITENGFIIRGRGFAYGFDEYTEHSNEQKKSAPGLVEESFGEAKEWVASAPKEPYFLFVHTYQVHHPYEPPAAYRGVFLERENHAGLQEDLYDAEILFLDNQLRYLFKAVEEAPGERDTLFVVVSDHGEEFREHGAMQHGTQVYEESIRVPLLFYGAGIETPRRITRQVSIVDVTPTVLDLVGIPTPPTLDGVSLAPAIRDGAEPPSRPLFAEAPSRMEWTTLMFMKRVEPIKLAVRFDDKKFILHRPDFGKAAPPVMFDLSKDPREENPLPVTGEDLELIEAMASDYMQRERLGASAKQDEETFRKEADPALVERLRSLGYLE